MPFVGPAARVHIGAASAGGGTLEAQRHQNHLLKEFVARTAWGLQDGQLAMLQRMVLLIEEQMGREMKLRPARRHRGEAHQARPADLLANLFQRHEGIVA